MANELLQRAISYAELGWHVFPIIPNTKRPLTKNGFKDSTTAPEQIKRWWEEFPNANIAIATGRISKIVVIDIDVKNGVNGFESLKQLSINTETLTAISPSGGHHLYYYLPQEHQINSSIGVLPGIDIKSDGGYVLAPGSVIEGKKYEWLNPDAPLIAVPAELLKILKERSAKGGKNSPTELTNKIPEGQRNSTLASIAGTLRRRGMGYEEIKAALIAINKQRCQPPLSDSDIDRIARSISNYPSSEPLNYDRDAPQFSEDALALEFTRLYSDDWRYVASWGMWLNWDGKRWRRETTLKAYDLARKVCRRLAGLCEKQTKSEKIVSAATVAAVERLARTDRAHAANAEQWDSDIFLFNTQAGTLDTKTGAVLPHEKHHYITRIANASPEGECPNWYKFLNDITNGNTELQDYLSRVAGYCLTGSTEEHVLFFLYGTGANGKSVFLNTLCSVWGDYATHAPLDTFLEARTDKHPTDLAKLRGARIVIATEVSQGKHWDEAKIKAITGGDTISARFMRQDFFDYKPQFKLLIAGNHKPSLRNIDEAMRRRIHLIPFTITIPPEKRDHKLTEKLLEERNGILRWAIEGCLKWLKFGLKPPEIVLSATEEYFESQDAIKRWIEDECILTPNGISGVDELFNSFKFWAENNGEFCGSKRRFSEELDKHGFTRRKTTGGKRVFSGILLKSQNSGANI